MAVVYSGATVVISADAVRNSADGCFGPYKHSLDRNVSISIPCINDQGTNCQVYARRIRLRGFPDGLEHHIKPTEPRWAIEPLPITLRGWCLQERLLAPRILHYCFTELVWECWSQTECQCTPTPQPILHHTDMSSMRLAALSGLATLYESTSDEYIYNGSASRPSFHPCLTHQSTAAGIRCAILELSVVTGEIKYEGDTDELGAIESEDDIEILGVEYDQSETNPYGPLKNCCITARGYLLPVHLDDNLSSLFDTSNFPEGHDLQPSPPRVGRVILDVHTGNMARHDIIVQEALFCTLSMIMEIALDTAERRVFKII
ncbi:hypothetical protein HBI72_205130 [Parastagonospora nodorum]|nr:hypothetical protein HBI72_205130 [Parastagonospora nodorum]